MYRILVAGGCGFIGKNFILRLLETRSDVSIINVDKLTYAAHQDMADFRCGDRYCFVKVDLADPAGLDLLAHEDIDAVVNFAAESHVDRSIASPVHFVYSNFIGTYNLLEFVRGRGVARYLQVSTDEVYGSIPLGESADETGILDPSSPYSSTKAGADLLVRSYFVTFGLPVLISRCSNNYGPFQFPEKMIPVILKNALQDQPIPVYGDGLNVRDWLFVEDHCDAILRILEQGIPGNIYNIGGGRELNNLDLVKFLLERVGKPQSLIRFVKDRVGHDRRYSIDFTKIRLELGWTPKVCFEDGMARTIAWYQQNPDFLFRTQA